jgi:hypothetical protein
MKSTARVARTAQPRTEAKLPKPEPELLTVKQIEEHHPALKGRVRGWLHRADTGDPDLAMLRLAIVRIGRSVFLSRPHFAQFLELHRCMPPAPARGRGSDNERERP